MVFMTMSATKVRRNREEIDGIIEEAKVKGVPFESLHSTKWSPEREERERESQKFWKPNITLRKLRIA